MRERVKAVDQAKAPAGVRAKVEERDKAAGGSLDQLTIPNPDKPENTL